MTNTDWFFDESMQTWLLGSQSHGCGVFFNESKWYANVCNGYSIVMFGPYQSREEAMQSAVKELGDSCE